MKIISLIILAFAMLSLTACQSTALDTPPDTPDQRSDALFQQMTGAGNAPESISEDLPAAPAEKDPEPVPAVFLEDIHEWADGNRLYNGDGTYDNPERYYADFEATDQGAVLWRAAAGAPEPKESYDGKSAAEFAKAHWNDGLDVCAPFISRCLKAGGVSIGSDSSTSLCLKLLNSGMGFGQFVPINPDRTVTLPEYAREGDIIQSFCPYEGLMIHSLMFVGSDENGNMKVCCHNESNSGAYAYHVARKCYDCTIPVKEVFYFHFVSESETFSEPLLNDGSVILFENSGYTIPNQDYNAEKAAAYSRANPLDGIGQFGAEHTWSALSEGGISVGYPVQTALFMQLMKSRHGSVQSIAINPDRTVTLPEAAAEGDVCFLYCEREAMMYSSFLIKGRDADGKMLAYSRDRINDERQAFRVESVCPSSVCDGEIREVLWYHFE